MTYDPPDFPPLPPPMPHDDGNSLLRDERRQRNLVIGLSVGAVVVLLVGIIAFALTRSGDDSPTATSPTVSLGTVASDTTTSSSTSTSTTSTSTTTSTVPIIAVADAGPDLAVDRASAVTLTAANLAEETPDEAVRWTQTSGPDVTGGTGTLAGPAAVVMTPDDVTTLAFRLEVAGTDGVATDDLVVRVFEDADRAVFVDGERGDDGGDGSLAAPYRSVARGVAAAADGRDVYVRSLGRYAAPDTLLFTSGMSLYGGFDEDWVRDVTRRVVIDGAPISLRVEGSGERWFSAVELTSADGGPDEHSIAIEVIDADVVHIEDSRIVAGDGGDSAARLNGGASVGVLVDGADEVLIERSTINSGRGADGLSGGATAGEARRAADGADAAGREPGAGGGDSQTRGGNGGQGGLSGPGSPAPGGGTGGTVLDPDGTPGLGGAGGIGGRGGDGGVGLTTAAVVVPLGADGARGADGSAGSGGRGGGGGFGPPLASGGGGGGGGAGGAGGGGADGGGGGVGSVGIWATDVNRLVVNESLVAGGRAGSGGTGYLPSVNGAGGAGGDGAVGETAVPDDGGAGGGAGGGGAGGAGGQGGGGAGGPSYGLLTTRVGSVDVLSSTVRAGGGGNGAAGGSGGAAGQVGQPGGGRSGGAGAASADGPIEARGVGASGGSSFGWFDESGANRTIEDAEFISGNAGRGGAGSVQGADGVAGDTNFS